MFFIFIIFIIYKFDLRIPMVTTSLTTTTKKMMFDSKLSVCHRVIHHNDEDEDFYTQPYIHVL